MQIKTYSNQIPEETELESLTSFYKAFSDPNRIRVLYTLFHSELSVGELADCLDITQSALSHQLRLLKQLRLVKYRREGKSILYSLADDHIINILEQGRIHIKEC